LGRFWEVDWATAIFPSEAFLVGGSGKSLIREHLVLAEALENARVSAVPTVRATVWRVLSTIPGATADAVLSPRTNAGSS
jgi:hypothetical protein